MGRTTAMEKTEEELKREIDELHRQQRQITDRLRDPRGLRRGGGLGGSGPRNFAANGARQRGFFRPADRNDTEDQPLTKRRLLSAVVKLEDGEIVEDYAAPKDLKKESAEEENVGDQSDGKPLNLQPSSWSRRDDYGYQRAGKREIQHPVIEHVPRVLPKNEDPSLVSRNKRMLGQLLGTLEKFRKEDVKLSETEAYKQRSNALQRAEQRAQEESERLRQQEREQIAEKRRRDLTLRARVAAKTEEKKLELLFLRWSEHHKKLCNFIRTKAEPPIYYLPKKPLEEDASQLEQRKEQEFLDWKAHRREELSEYQKQLAEQYLGNVEIELERWQNVRKARRPNNDANLQETMDKELETHRLEHGPKTRKIPGGSNNEEEDDVEDINVGEDDLMDDVLEADDSGRRGDEAAKPEAGGTSPQPDNHRLEHGPKTRKIPGGSNNEEEDDVEDINVGEDDLMDDVLEADDSGRRGDEAAKPEAGGTSPQPDNHRLEHGPKTRKIPGGSNNEEEDDVEDINVGEDDLMDDVLEADDSGRRGDEAAKPEAGGTSPQPDNHRLEHGPKTRKIPGGSNNEEEDDVEDINVGEDDLMDDVLEADDSGRRGDEAAKPEAGGTSPQPDKFHRLEHGPKTRKIPGGSNNEEEDYVEDINVGEDDLMDDVLEADDSGRRGDEAAKPEAGGTSPQPDNNEDQ
ncbi:uncharacterized protein LOC126660731 [Mercurialis annua]|uniref:uncharacterized protein LOC126660731 n=1 Tax=Mercurialis annua TaxID=3986 RepID=UPI0024AFD8D4|nr:uncharacterized protein LOC126660731 [Mercurialis annua]XP_055959886.1 uncharacterized protein LOC126660731 [Mercurialis annua]